MHKLDFALSRYTANRKRGKLRGRMGRRARGVRQAFLKKEEFEALVDAASLEKLAKMLRILGFLTQTKVYLFWKN